MLYQDIIYNISKQIWRMTSEKAQNIDYIVKDHKSYKGSSEIKKINQKSDKFTFACEQN